MVKLPPLEQILAAYEYNPETGEVKHKRRKKPIGSSRKGRHGRIRISGRVYILHRVIWYMHTGEDPGVCEIDHINGDGWDNRWCNLRLCTRTENNCNQRSWGIQQQGNRWTASIYRDRRRVYYSSHDCPLLARVAYVDAKRELHGEFAGV